MLHDFLFTPFSDAGQRQLYEQLRATLQADSAAGTTLLLGNFAVEDDGEALDAVIIRPHSITVLVLVPRGGQLQVPALGYGAWQLAGKPLHGAADADNPYEQFHRQKAALAGWLGGQFTPEQANLQFVSGLVLFAAPVTFGPGVEAQLGQQPDGGFQLLGSLDQLPRRLAQFDRPEINLSEADLTEWASTLAEDPDPEAAPVPEPAAAPVAERSFLRRAWGWLGAEDIPEDVPYGGQPAAQAAASAAEKQRLEQVQREAQAQVQQQLQAMEAREAERERRIEELRSQLAQAPPVTTEAQALQERLAAESQEKAALEASIRTSRAESETRNRELDTRIAQLGQLIEQLNHRTATAAAAPHSGAAHPASATTSSKRVPRGRRRLARAAAVAGVVALLGAGAWGVSQMGSSSSPSAAPNGPVTAQPNVTAAGSTPASAVPTAEPPQSSIGAEANSTAPGSDAAPAKADIYEARYPYADGYARVKLNGAYTFIDKAEKPFGRTFLEAKDFSEGYAAVRDQRGWQYINGPAPEDPAVPPFLFLEAYPFRDGLARVRLEPGYTYITKRNLAGLGPSVFQLYEAATDFENGRAEVTMGGRRFTIDQNGQPVN